MPLTRAGAVTDAYLPAEVHLRLGATPLGDGRCQFLVWAPLAEKIEVVLDGGKSAIMQAQDGYHRVVLEGVRPGSRYKYQLGEGKLRPDPASRYQPDGVHGSSQVFDPGAFAWSDQQWRGIELEDYISYELHVGTMTAAGTFEALIGELPRLKALRITAIELMPVAQFPGSRNWGYDGTHPFAVQNSYGGPVGLQGLVNAAHQHGLAVILDVVYNHLGPEGNYLAEFGPYFTDRYRTPWGQAINFDGEQSDNVVRYFIENAVYWLRDFHIDALRLDAIHGIVDRNARPFLELLAVAVERFRNESDRKVFLIAESDLNDSRIVRAREQGGYGLDAQWNDDFHHALHTLVTGERDGYYLDFGGMDDLARSLREGYVYSGQYSEFRRRRHGNSSRGILARQLVVFSQNHDQVGNRMLGERLSAMVDFATQKLSAAMVLFSPFLPLLFMGEEYGERAPFLYFTSHSDPQLVEAVRRGRREEFAAFRWEGTPPDPQAQATFSASKLNRDLLDQEPHRTLSRFYQELIRLRTSLPALRELSKERIEIETATRESGRWLTMRRWCAEGEVLVLANFDESPAQISGRSWQGAWNLVLDSAVEAWRGPGSHLPREFTANGQTPLAVQPRSIALYRRS